MFRLKCRSSSQQAQGPDRATVRIDSTSGFQHDTFALAAQLTQRLAQGLVQVLRSTGGFRHVLKGLPQCIGRAVHQPQVQV